MFNKKYAILLIRNTTDLHNRVCEIICTIKLSLYIHNLKRHWAKSCQLLKFLKTFEYASKHE